MNCHQILTGACNSGCNAVGSVEGVPFTVRKKNYNSFSLKEEYLNTFF